MEFFFENLDVYKKSLHLAQRVNNVMDRNSNKAPRANDEMKATTIAIASGVASAYGFQEADDRLRVLEDTRAIAYRCVPYLEMFKDLDCFSIDEYNGFREDIENIVRMISGIIKKTKLKNNGNNGTTK